MYLLSKAPVERIDGKNSPWMTCLKSTPLPKKYFADLYPLEKSLVKNTGMLKPQM